jgi:peptidoglycan/xylan/chitin deacetylase (PgdA/CDA1 family)
MIAEILTGAGLAGAGVLAYGVRGRSARLFGPAVWKGSSTRRAIALTFDDGPSESTSDLLNLLHDHHAHATFFQCGHHVRRLPRISQRCLAEGHEIGNHSETHPAFVLRSPQFMNEQLARTQTIIEEATGRAPRLFRPPFGARWFGLRAVEQRLGLKTVLWTTIARDWKLPAEKIVAYVGPRVMPGAIFSFHDGRELVHGPDISNTLTALAVLLPRWAEAGYEFITISEMFGWTQEGA